MKTVFNTIRNTLFFAVLFLFTACETTEDDYAAGDEVEVLSAGVWYPSEVLEVKPGLYKIHYINRDNSGDTWVGGDMIRLTEENSKQDNNVPEVTATEKIPEANAALPKIIGTSWSLLCIYEKGTQPKYLHTFPEYLFCNNGRWELHSLSNSVGQMGTYTIEGDQLITVHDGADKLTGNYKITWNAAENYLELDDGKLIFRLRYLVEAKC